MKPEKSKPTSCPMMATSSGRPVGDNQNSVTAGPRGPVLMEDNLLFEKMAQFDRERIPERVVHAKGAGALYQSVCFPIYGIPKVRRADYLVFDHGRLAYLNMIEKVGCIYCSYTNGVLALITEVAGRTEQSFCPIKHAQRLGHIHSRYAKFLPSGDASAYRGQSERMAHAFDDIKTPDK